MTEDAEPSKMIERKWALAEGRFKMLTKDEARDLEESEDFKVTEMVRPNNQVFKTDDFRRQFKEDDPRDWCGTVRYDLRYFSHSGLHK